MSEKSSDNPTPEQVAAASATYDSLLERLTVKRAGGKTLSAEDIFSDPLVFDPTQKITQTPFGAHLKPTEIPPQRQTGYQIDPSMRITSQIPRQGIKAGSIRYEKPDPPLQTLAGNASKPPSLDDIGDGNGPPKRKRMSLWAMAAVMIPFFAAALFGIFWWENQNISHLKALLLKEDPSIVFLPAGGISQQSN